MVTLSKPDEGRGAGVLPDWQLWDLIRRGQIEAAEPIEPDQVQPNSLDLRLGNIAHRTRCSFLPVGRPVRELLSKLKTNDVPLPESGFVMDCGHTYIVPLMERLNLPAELSGTTNPKSSTGRLDILVRVLTDEGHSFDVIPPGYCGRLYLEVISRSFPIVIRPGDTLAQLRVIRGRGAALSDDELRNVVDHLNVIRGADRVPYKARNLEFNDGVVLSLDLRGDGGRDATIGYRSKSCTPVVDLRKRGLRVRKYWDRIHVPSRPSDPLILEPSGFYIFASQERVSIPSSLCAEMVAIDVRSGEVRMHYAGFFDSGFGLARDDGRAGARVVLEVRNMDVPFLVQHGQKLFRLRFFQNSAPPSQLYGHSRTSNYQGQGLKLAKQFTKADARDPAQLEIQWMPTDEAPPVLDGHSAHSAPSQTVASTPTQGRAKVS